MGLELLGFLTLIRFDRHIAQVQPSEILSMYKYLAIRLSMTFCRSKNENFCPYLRLSKAYLRLSYFLNGIEIFEHTNQGPKDLVYMINTIS